MIVPGQNFYNKPIEVNHADLERADNNSMYRSVCPMCKEGVLLVRRNVDTAKFEAEDMCTLCGQRFVYMDIETLKGQ